MSTTDPLITLKSIQLSAVYHTADRVSATGQRTTKRLVTAELVALVIASISGITTLRVGSARIDLLAVVAIVAFLVAMISMVTRATRKPEEDWYKGRAAAESARTLGWKYSVGATPFAVGGDEGVAINLFLTQLQDVVEQLRNTRLASPDSVALELTESMKRLRSADLPTRRRVYRDERIQDQLDWYARRSADHGKSARLWLMFAIVSSALGIAAAILKLLIIDVDLFGVFAAIASSSVAWNQLNQHRNQATAYAVTAREISIIRDQIDVVSDDDWARFVGDSEDAISREHTMWLARHGQVALRP